MIIKIWHTEPNRNPYVQNYPDYEGFVVIPPDEPFGGTGCRIRIVGWIREGPTGQHIHMTEKSA